MAAWTHVVAPKEHGGWSLALEPVALGLIAAPSVPGLFLGLAAIAVFLARRPAKLRFADSPPDRRRTAGIALAVCSSAALACLGLALAAGPRGGAWLPWLVPSAVGGLIFLRFDGRNESRRASAEIVGAAAFSFLPAAMAVAAGRTAGVALALGLIMCGRALPTVLLVRTYLRHAKEDTGHPLPAIIAALLACGGGFALAHAGVGSRVAAWALAGLAVRAALYWVWPRPPLRARTIGIMELIWGSAFVTAVGAFWPR